MSLEVDQPSWIEIFQAFGDRLRASIHVGLPGVITSFDASTYSATVQLGVQSPAIDDSGETSYEVIPPLTDVPVARARGGGFSLSIPHGAGDAVFVVFSEADPAAWRRSGNPEPPDSVKRFGLYAFAFPCDGRDSSPGEPSESGKAVLQKDGGGPRLVVDSSAVHVGGDTASDFLVLEQKLIAKFNLHTHTCAAPASPSSPPVIPLAPGDTGATKAKGI